jgi:putative inorganic carbon (HCO3(-)) transporter
MMPRTRALAAVFLSLVAPVLMFPRLVGSLNAWVAMAAALVAMIVAVRLLAEVDRVLAWCAAALAVTAVAGFVRSPLVLDSLSHFSGLGLGLLTMATVAVWCHRRQRLAVGVLLVMIFGLAVLTVGFRSTTYGSKGVLSGTPGAPLTAARANLPLQSLHSRLEVNPNALAATAMLLLPIAVAVTWPPPRRGRLRRVVPVAGLVTAATALTILALMESRSTLVAAAVVAWVWSRRWFSTRTWWLCGVMAIVVASVAGLGMWSTVSRSEQVVRALSGRADIWAAGWEGLRSSPWLGIGFDYFRHSGLALQPYPPNLLVGAPHAHNIFLQTALDIGLFGLACYLAIIGIVLRRASALLSSGGDDVWVRAVGLGAALSLVSVHVFGLLDAIPLGAKVGLFQWLACGLILAAWRVRTSSEET